jgi:hypothetical protein
MLHHFRQQEKLEWVASDDNFDSKYQQTRLNPKGEIRVLPGDSMTLSKPVKDSTFISSALSMYSFYAIILGRTYKIIRY